jgi:hypothetical protein
LRVSRRPVSGATYPDRGARRRGPGEPKPARAPQGRRTSARPVRPPARHTLRPWESGLAGEQAGLGAQREGRALQDEAGGAQKTCHVAEGRIDRPAGRAGPARRDRTAAVALRPSVSTTLSASARQRAREQARRQAPSMPRSGSADPCPARSRRPRGVPHLRRRGPPSSCGPGRRGRWRRGFPPGAPPPPPRARRWRGCRRAGGPPASRPGRHPQGAPAGPRRKGRRPLDAAGVGSPVAPLAEGKKFCTPNRSARARASRPRNVEHE